MNNVLHQLSEQGVAVWLDDLSRERLVSGDLAKMVADQEVVGVTTNPTIFHSAISTGTAYRGQLMELSTLRISAADAVRVITCHDVRAACDVLRPIYDATEGADGWVSIEVDPHLAHSSSATFAEARLLQWLVDRPNVMIKIPATTEALPAITACLAAGISVNVTLLFATNRYAAVLGAFLDGMEQAREAGLDLRRIASVASFFISRVDAAVDERIDEINTAEAAALRGQAAIANARAAYEYYDRTRESAAWRNLAAAGARPQRLLWASTGVKDDRYDDTRYVVELVAQETVNTMPAATLAAVADHGAIRGDTITPNFRKASDVVRNLAAIGVSLSEVTTHLERDGLRRFRDSWDALISDVDTSLHVLASAQQPRAAEVV